MVVSHNTPMGTGPPRRPLQDVKLPSDRGAISNHATADDRPRNRHRRTVLGSSYMADISSVITAAALVLDIAQATTALAIDSQLFGYIQISVSVYAASTRGPGDSRAPPSGAARKLGQSQAYDARLQFWQLLIFGFMSILYGTDMSDRFFFFQVCLPGTSWICLYRLGFESWPRPLEPASG